jgi:hypothetical protein
VRMIMDLRVPTIKGAGRRIWIPACAGMTGGASRHLQERKVGGKSILFW